LNYFTTVEENLTPIKLKTSKHNIYGKIVFAAVLILLINQCFIQYVLSNKEKDSLIINQAGKQRMYSQRILSLYFKKDNNQELKKVLSEWKNSHFQLLDHFSHSSNIFNNENIKKNFLELSKYIEQAISIINSDNYSYDELFENQDIYLHKMNDTVSMIEASANTKLHAIIIFELVFACFSLFLIYYEVNKIFKPIINELLISNKLLNQSNSLLKKYAYIASHNFKSPIRTITSYTGLFKKKHGHLFDERDTLYHSFITDATRQLKKASDDLVLYSEIHCRGVEVKPVNILEFYQSIISELKQENNEVKYEIYADNSHIKADIELLKIAIKSIIRNSLKFKNEKRALIIKLKHHSENKSERLIVEDNGVGVDNKYQDKAFEIFEKIHSSQEYPGNGIGLAICKSIIDKHEGKVKISSPSPVGTVTTIVLPSLQPA